MLCPSSEWSLQGSRCCSLWHSAWLGIGFQCSHTESMSRACCSSPPCCWCTYQTTSAPTLTSCRCVIRPCSRLVFRHEAPTQAWLRTHISAHQSLACAWELIEGTTCLLCTLHDCLSRIDAMFELRVQLRTTISPARVSEPVSTSPSPTVCPGLAISARWQEGSSWTCQTFYLVGLHESSSCWWSSPQTALDIWTFPLLSLEMTMAACHNRHGSRSSQSPPS